MTRVAAYDCGTNTIKLLVADLDPGTGEEVELLRDLRMVRLGQDVDATGRLADAAMERVFAAIEDWKPQVDAYDVQAMRFCATSAARDAANADVFIKGVIDRIGVPPEVLSGDEEARLSFLGATRTLPEHPDPTLVLDIGGGSTEFVINGRHHSLDIGSVRLTERFLVSDPPRVSELESAAAFIDRELDSLTTFGVFPDLARTCVGVAGTVTTLAAMALDLPEYDRKAIHHSRIQRDDIREMMLRLVGMTVAERKTLPFLHPGRADVIGAGALILDRIMLRLDVDSVLVSEHDILDGIAWSIA